MVGYGVKEGVPEFPFLLGLVEKVADDAEGSDAGENSCAVG